MSKNAKNIRQKYGNSKNVQILNPRLNRSSSRRSTNLFKIVISHRASKTFSSKKKNQDQAAFRNSWATESEAIKGYVLQFELLLNIPSEMPIDTYRQAKRDQITMDSAPS